MRLTYKMVNINLIGKIENKRIKEYTKKDGSGKGEMCIYTINGIELTTFNDFSINFKIGTEVEIVYTEKQNGRFINRNIVYINEKVDRPKLSKETLKKIEEVGKTMEETGLNAADENFADELEKRKKKDDGITTFDSTKGSSLSSTSPCGENIVNVGDKTYKVTLQEIP